MLIRAVRDVVIAITLDTRPSVRPSVCLSRVAYILSDYILIGNTFSELCPTVSSFYINLPILSTDILEKVAMNHPQLVY